MFKSYNGYLKVTHGRLAACNIFLNQLNEVKIAGFGPISAGQEGEEDEGDADSENKVGETPYMGISRNLLQRLKSGERLEKPELCDETWYNVMQDCWEYDPKKRPCFAEIRDQLDKFFFNYPGGNFYFNKR
ncbi:tyrosine kinase receptor Cad96Ca-like [Mya arenaria]|uniref:tyrosine kinase receptor Cad96Ca-like n=1 Tax=Mya arenaria TaxID=6604 RepID=UPI0022E902A9|nr:tyrosine kinase receptor Cad96Ca-like [Mya arenaria]